MITLDQLPSHVGVLCRAFFDGLRDSLGAHLFAVYLYGAMTFPDSQDQIQDVDYHVILEGPLDNRQRQTVDGLRRDLAHRFPPLGGELDGYYIAREDTRRTAPPPTQMWPLWRMPVDAAWALHCAHIRAGRVITLHGPDPLEVYSAPSWPDLEAALYGEIRFVDQHLADEAYCVLNACRLIYSFETKDVVTSKRAAAAWAMTALPEEWGGLIEAALRTYRGAAMPEDTFLLQDRVRSFVQHAWHRIARSRSTE